MAAQTNQNNKKEHNEKRMLVLAILAPIVIALIITGVPVIWKGLLSVFKVIFPNIWVFVVYLYIAIIAFLIGRITKKWKNAML